jgi:hypothetical protein
VSQFFTELASAQANLATMERWEAVHEAEDSVTSVGEDDIATTIDDEARQVMLSVYRGTGQAAIDYLTARGLVVQSNTVETVDGCGGSYERRSIVLGEV